MTTRQPYKPKYIPLYAARTNKKDIEPSNKLEPQDISDLRQQLDSFREEIRTSPVSYPRAPKESQETKEMADPRRRFAIPTDLSRFERLRRGLRREEEADINLGTNYSRYRLKSRRNSEEEEAPETRTTRVSRRNRERSPSAARLRSTSRSRSQNGPNNLHDDLEEAYPEIKQESEDEESNLPPPRIRRYAGYNAFTGSPQKKVTISEPEEHSRPRSKSAETKAEARVYEATKLMEDKLEQYMGAIEAAKGPEVAQEFVREYQRMMDLLSEEYQALNVEKEHKESSHGELQNQTKQFNQTKQSTQKSGLNAGPQNAPKTPHKKGIIKYTTHNDSRRPIEDLDYSDDTKDFSDDDDYIKDEDIEDFFGKQERPKAKKEKREEDYQLQKEKRKKDYELQKESRRVQENLHELERDVDKRKVRKDVREPLKMDSLTLADSGVWTKTRSTISASYRAVVGAWYTTASPLLLLATSFFFWQAIRLALTFFCLDDDEEFVRQQLVQGMSYAEIEHMWGLRGFNICGGVWRPPVPQ